MTRLAIRVVVLILLVLSAAAGAQEPANGHMMMHGSGGAPGGHMAGIPKATAADVASPEAIVNAYYAALSGPAGKKRDWNRFLSLFFPGARLLPTEGKGHSGTMPHTFTPSKYLFDTESNMLQEGYIPKEVSHRSESFGKLLHVWSTYEVRHTASDAEPFVRGVTSFQLFNNGQRWWIVNVAWQPETSKLKLAEKDLSR
ncbi:MAG TPA: hypothetical protein VGP73_21835 [Thermoanaerobaculia bacterium]